MGGRSHHRKNQGSLIGTLVERQTRFIRLLHLPARDAGSLHIAITTAVRDLPLTLIRSITWDQGIEMARHTDITRRFGRAGLLLRLPFTLAAREQREQQRLLRQYFPKSTDLNRYTPEHLRAVEIEINNSPRRVLGDRSPAELFTTLLASPDHQTLRR